MRRLSEVSRITGVTRKSLQEYARIGLLKPTEKTAGGYWLYDDQAIQNLMLIQIFVEAEYKRKEIKKILESPEMDLRKEFQNLLNRLENKRKKIDGMINTITSILAVFDLPKSTLIGLSKVDISQMYQKKSFKDNLIELANIAGDETPEERKQRNAFLLAWQAGVAVENYVGTPINSRNVQQAVKTMYDAWQNYLMVIDPDYNESVSMYSDAEKIDIVDDFVTQFTQESEVMEMFELQGEKGAVDYMLQVVHLYRKQFGTQDGEE